VSTTKEEENAKERCKKSVCFYKGIKWKIILPPMVDYCTQVRVVGVGDLITTYLPTYILYLLR
jgi:hypothetical protein